MGIHAKISPSKRTWYFTSYDGQGGTARQSILCRNTKDRGDFFNPDCAAGGYCIIWINHESTAGLTRFTGPIHFRSVYACQILVIIIELSIASKILSKFPTKKYVLEISEPFSSWSRVPNFIAPKAISIWG